MKFLFIWLLAVIVGVHSGVQCHGPIPGVQYRYRYVTEQILNNADQREPAGFGAEAEVTFENIWQSPAGYLARLSFENFHYKTRVGSSSSRFKDAPVVEQWPPVLVAIDAGSGLGQHLYMPVTARRHSVDPTQLNLVVAVLDSLRSKFSRRELETTTIEGRSILRKSSLQQAKPESILAPQVSNTWEVSAHLAADHDFVELVSGWQNVTIESRLYPAAHSILTVNYKLKLLQEATSVHHPALKSLANLPEVISHYSQATGQEYRQLPVHLVSEKRPCGPHYCHQDLAEFVAANRAVLTESGRSFASVRLGGGYLRLVNYLQVNADRITRKEVEQVLVKESKNGEGSVYITLLDAIAGSRHSAALSAAFNVLKLPKCTGEVAVEACERFLTELGISALAGSNSATLSSMVEWQVLSGEGLIELFVPMLTIGQWADERVKHSFALTVATLVDAANRLETRIEETLMHAEIIIKPFHSDHHSNLDHASALKRIGPLSEKVIKYLISELDHCKEVECRVVYLQALGNARILSKYGVFQALRKYALRPGHREQVAALQAFVGALKREWPHKSADEKFVTRVRLFLVRIVYDSSVESTARLVAAQALTSALDHDGQAIVALVNNLDRFPTELATLIWKRVVTETAKTEAGQKKLAGARAYRDWSSRAKVLNGSSDAFQYAMGSTADIEARYGVGLEIHKGKIPKETAFNVELVSNNPDSIAQELINVGLFARGLSSFAGGDEVETDDQESNEVEPQEEDSSMAGLALQVLGTQLRPYIFFRSAGELMGHVWAGTGSEPTPVFRANLLLADYYDVRPLINGFLVEQRLKGMLSLDLNGEVQISLWNRNSHSNVQTVGAMLFLGSQEILTSDPLTSARKYFSIGGETSMDFVTDFDFTSPYQICIQITTPEFVFRHNNRKYEQVHSTDLHRRIHRRRYRIAGKSYVLNEDNSRMCAAMNG